MATVKEKLEIRRLNDAFRRDFQDGRVVATSGVAKLPFISLLRAIQNFDNFDHTNDPFGEHDFGQIEIDDEKIFWKIDYYDRKSNMEYGAENPADPATTLRVMTIMLASEY